MSVTNTTKLYPGYLEVVDQLSKLSPGNFVSDEDLSDMLGCSEKSTEFGLGLMKARNLLVDDHNIVLLRARQDGTSGYTLATEEEKVQIYIPRQQRKIRNTIRRQQHVAVNVDRDQLSTQSQQRLDHQVAVSGLQAAFQAQLNRRKLTNQMILKVPPALASGSAPPDNGANED